MENYIRLKNISGIKDSTLELNNLNINAGLNNTGKTTISKILSIALDCVSRTKTIFETRVIRRFNILLEEYIEKEKNNELYLIRASVNRKENPDFIEDLIRYIYENDFQTFQNKYYDHTLKVTINTDESMDFNISDNFLEKLSEHFDETLISCLNYFIKSNLRDKFKIALSNVFTKEEPSFELKYNNYLLIWTDSKGIEDASILEFKDSDYKPLYFDGYNQVKNHYNNTMSNFYFRFDNNANYEFNIKNTEYINIINDLDKILWGTSEISIVEKEVMIVNLASGLKIFNNIRRLINESDISYGNYLILDEPEIHVHPSRQVELAYILVLLINKLKLNVFINSHSSIFIETIYLFSEEVNLDIGLSLSANENGFHISKKCEIKEIFDNLNLGYDALDGPTVGTYLNLLKKDKNGIK